MQSVANTIASGHDVEIILPGWIIDPNTINTGNATVHVVANPNDLLTVLDQILSNNQIDYLVPSFPDAMTEKIAEICQRHTVAFVGKSTARMLSSKHNYYRLWKALSIPVPDIYSEITQVTLPCIVKPYRGQASIGVKILTNASELAEFFSTDEYIVHFSPTMSQGWKHSNQLFQTPFYRTASKQHPHSAGGKT
jgi:carbamoylphosphate synthase large subunit